MSFKFHCVIFSDDTMRKLYKALYLYKVVYSIIFYRQKKKSDPFLIAINLRE